MKETEFAYASAYTRTLENKMLRAVDFEALLNAPSLGDAFRVLSDKGYGNCKQPTEIEAMLKEELNHVWNEVKEACPPNTPIDILLYQNDFHNLKTILKAIFSGSAYEHLLLEPYTISPDELYHAIMEGKVERTDSRTTYTVNYAANRERIFSAYPSVAADIFINAASQAYHILARDNDGQLAEIVLDIALFNAMREAAKQSKNAFLIDWVDLNIAIMNMKIALRGAYSGRGRDFLIGAMLDCERLNINDLADAAAHDVSAVLLLFTQGGFIGAERTARESFAAFEKWCDNELIGCIKQAREKIFGVETVFAFLIAKQFEIQTVRIILSGIRSGISVKVLRERLRNNYA